MMLRIERYGHTRHWALYDDDSLVVVTVYKCGAEEVRRRLAAQPLTPPDAAAAREPQRLEAPRPRRRSGSTR